MSKLSFGGLAIVISHILSDLRCLEATHIYFALKPCKILHFAVQKVVIFTTGVLRPKPHVKSSYDKYIKWSFETLLEVSESRTHMWASRRAPARAKFREIYANSTFFWEISISKRCSTGGSTGRQNNRNTKYVFSAFICTPNHPQNSHGKISNSFSIPPVFHCNTFK